MPLLAEEGFRYVWRNSVEIMHVFEDERRQMRRTRAAKMYATPNAGREPFLHAPARPPERLSPPRVVVSHTYTSTHTRTHRRNRKDGRRERHRGEPRRRASARSQRRPLHHVPHQVRGHLGDVQEGRGLLLDRYVSTTQLRRRSRRIPPALPLATRARRVFRRVRGVPI